MNLTLFAAGTFGELPWYIVRVAGFVAVALLVLLILTGIGRVTGVIYRFVEPLKTWALHKTLAIALAATIVLHVGFLVFRPETTESHTFSFQKLAMAAGVLATWLMAAIILSSAGFFRKKLKLWRAVHLSSYATVVLVFIHALGVGTDLRGGWARTAWIFTGVAVALAVAVRLIQMLTGRREKPKKISKR